MCRLPPSGPQTPRTGRDGGLASGARRGPNRRCPRWMITVSERSGWGRPAGQRPSGRGEGIRTRGGKATRPGRAGGRRSPYPCHGTRESRRRANAAGDNAARPASERDGDYENCVTPGRPPAPLDELTKTARASCKEIAAPLDEPAGRTLLGSHGLREPLSRRPALGKYIPLDLFDCAHQRRPLQPGPVPADHCRPRLGS